MHAVKRGTCPARRESAASDCYRGTTKEIVGSQGPRLGHFSASLLDLLRVLPTPMPLQKRCTATDLIM
jgi:hypothetical protein